MATLISYYPKQFQDFLSHLIWENKYVCDDIGKRGEVKEKLSHLLLPVRWSEWVLLMARFRIYLDFQQLKPPTGLWKQKQISRGVKG